MTRKTSIKDIAARAGVSLTTVSIVLNGRAREMKISDAMAEKITSLAKKMNYRPNQFAKGLRTGKTNTIGLIVDDISNYFFGHLAKFVEEEADVLGYTVMFCSSENNEGKSRNILNMLVDKQMDGYIIAPTTSMLPELERLVREKKPAVLIDRYYPQLDTSYVTIDNTKGSLDAVNYLAKKGHTKIALVTNETDQVQMVQRISGYADGLQRNKLPFDKTLVKKIKFGLSDEKLVKDIRQFLTAKEGEIDAIFFTSNNLGIAGLEALHMIGKKIPDDISVLCFDDNDLFRLGTPGITVVSQPIKTIAKKAVELLVRQISQVQSETEHVVLLTSMIERESVNQPVSK
ncbi:LacI family DNA-binding transcriptional regulator [Flavihumibacter profundi]|uniref:LacI family DNA-binding transcriptional regulator n=1 Tax=Flavihumibacter profundi TaxID=2716883 RepID=UPI001CC814ED|nr:LacI family DNA-binding transcriptional regulator [Flavihumibacter profundi]MBZ5858042.1 LacI family transcriptional regulator [Flavihumibacter profundi]